MDFGAISVGGRRNMRYGPAPGAGGSYEARMNALAAAGKLAAWYQTSDLTSIWLAYDETGGNVSADGQTFGKIDDTSGNSVDFLQSDNAKEPQVKWRLKANADLSGQPELITNGDPASGVTTGWSAFADEVLSVVSGRWRVTMGADGAAEPIYQKIEGLTAGKLYAYTSSARYIGTNGAMGAVVREEAASGTTLVNHYGFVDAGPETTIFRATKSYVYALMKPGYGTAGTYGELGTLSLKEVPEGQYYIAAYSPGVDELLTGSPGMYAQGGMAFVAGVTGAAQSAKQLYSESLLSNTQPLYAVGTGSVDTAKLRLYARNGASTVLLDAESTIDVFDESPHVIGVWDTGTGYEFYVDLAAAGSGSYTRSGTLAPDNATFFAIKHTSETLFFKGDLVNPVMANPAVISKAEFMLAQRELCERMGVTPA